MTKQLICITTGEPAGIGPEICLDLAYYHYNQSATLLLLGDINLLRQRARLTHKRVELQVVTLSELATLPPANRGHLYVLHQTCPRHDCLGKPKTINAPYVLALLDQAIAICKSGLSQIIVTAPLNKDVINQSGLKFSGHTEYFAEKFHVNKVIMMLSNPLMNVALLTTHLPLRSVAEQVTSENLDQTLKIIHQTFQDNFKLSRPRIAVCGLNPHAGENGYLGSEEQTIINPLIRRWQAAGYAVSLKQTQL